MAISDRQKIVMLVGPDMCGKTTLSKEISHSLHIPRFKAADEHNNFLGEQDTFINHLKYSDFRMCDFLAQTGHNVIMDRAYPCEWVYSRYFNRKTDDKLLRKLDDKYAGLHAGIVVCTRKSFKGIVDNLDESIGENSLIELAGLYDEFANWTNCNVFKLYVDDGPSHIDTHVRQICEFIGT